MATGFRGFGAREYNLHSGLARVCVSYHGLQQPGGQDPGRATSAAGHTHRAGVRVLRLLEGSHDERHVGSEFHVAHRRETVSRVLCKYLPGTPSDPIDILQNKRKSNWC